MPWLTPLPKDVRRSLSPWRRSLGVNRLAVRPASCASRRSAWTTDGRRTDWRMPKLTRKQRARGAKEKLDQLCAPALRTLRLNLLNASPGASRGHGRWMKQQHQSG
ncbi:unnamed protein product [Cladocopium goreaui]|uniref:Uncharacterized protein n=1 Tax=Cladocopium goreaui TaxID=2562237 RepID=A0A9P1FFN8_9DINO|nr:unnamed protein product [Cladocopium goreaui]